MSISELLEVPRMWLQMQYLAVKEMRKGGRLGIKTAEGDFYALATPTLQALSDPNTMENLNLDNDICGDDK